MDHLFLGTNAENTADKTAKGRQVKGEEVHTSKLTEEIVLSIRREYKAGRVRKKDLAVKYNVTRSLVDKITLRIIWKHLE